MRRVIAAATLFLTLAGASSGFAQGALDSVFALPDQLNITGAGARAAGMGGAFMAVSNDASAITWNPAGMYLQEEPVLSFQWNNLAPRGRSTYLGQEFEQSGSFKALGAFSILAPIRVKGHPFVAAVNYGRVEDQYVSTAGVFQYMIDPDAGADRFDSTGVTEQWNESYRSGLDAVRIGFGTRLSEHVAGGLVLNAHTGKALYNNRYVVTIDTTSPGNPFIDFRKVTQVREVVVVDSTHYSGVNFGLGLLYDGEKFNAGLMIRTPYTLKLDIDRTIAVARTNNGIPDQGDSVILHVDNTVWRLDMPTMVALGLAYEANENFLWALDLEYRGFSSSTSEVRTEFEIVPGAKDREVFEERPLNWDNVLIFRTGGEYRWETGSTVFPIVPIRAGVSLQPLAAIDESAVGISFGLGVQWSQIHLDAAYVSTSFDIAPIDFFSLETRQREFKFTFTGTF